MKKRIYIKPDIQVYHLCGTVNLLQDSVIGNNTIPVNPDEEESQEGAEVKRNTNYVNWDEVWE